MSVLGFAARLQAVWASAVVLSASLAACSGSDDSPGQQTVSTGQVDGTNAAATVGAQTTSATTGDTASVGVETTSTATSGSVTASSSVGGASTQGSTTDGLTVTAATGTGDATALTGDVGVGSSSVTASAGGTSTTGLAADAGSNAGGRTAGGTETTGDGTGGTEGSFSVCSSPPPGGTPVVTIHVIGDSTASVYASDLYPRTGWGQVLGDYYSPACAVVSDKALSGRSSKSFYDEGAWAPVRDALAPGDFVLIQFGHNDEKTDDATRYTDPQLIPTSVRPL